MTVEIATIFCLLLLMIGSIFILGGALQYTGVLQRAATALLHLAGNGERRLTGLLMAATGAVSGFMNNTTVAAVFVPPVSGPAGRAGISGAVLVILLG